MDWLDASIGAATSALLLGVGHLINRRLTNAGSREKTGLYSDVADLMLKLRGAGLSVEEVRSFQAALTNRVRQTAGAAVPREELAAQKPDEYWTQARMNQRAAAEYGVVSARLDQVLAELSGLLDLAEEGHLERSQGAWREHVAAEAELAAAKYEGGTIQPLIRTSELSALSEDRIRRVQAMIDERRAELAS